jgi:cold shock CspA family protein
MDRGFCFIKLDQNAPDLFAHLQGFRNGGYDGPIERGMRFSFEIVDSKKPGLKQMGGQVKRLAGVGDDTPAPERPWWDKPGAPQLADDLP